MRLRTRAGSVAASCSKCQTACSTDCASETGLLGSSGFGKGRTPRFANDGDCFAACPNRVYVRTSSNVATCLLIAVSGP